MLRGYFDESGASHDSRIVCMGGCIAPVESWTEFERKWQEALSRYSVSWFHMTDFENYQGEFRGWTKKKHENLLAELLATMNSHVEIHLATGDDASEYRLQPAPKDDPYFNCLMEILDTATTYVGKVKPQETIEMFFADHDDFSRRVRRLYPQVRDVGGWYQYLARDEYRNPRDTLPLQAADIVAYEVRKEIERQLNGCKRPVRWPMKQLKNVHFSPKKYLKGFASS